MDPLISPGALAPSFHLPDLEGKLRQIEEARGKILILNFWSAECPWSERTDRELVEASKVWGEEVLLWPVASNANEPLVSIREAARERKLPMLLLDRDQHVADLYEATVTPHLFVVDAKGFVRYQGAPDDVTFRQRVPTRFWALAAVEALLAGQLPDPARTTPYGCTIVRHT